MIFYSLGNFIFDTNYQRSQLYTDVGVLLKLNFTSEKIDFDAIGIRIDRENGKIVKHPLPDIFTNVPANEYELLAPLGVKAFVCADTRKLFFLNPAKYRDDPSAVEQYFSRTHKDCSKNAHMDFEAILPKAKEYEKMEWKNSKLESVKEYVLTLL